MRKLGPYTIHENIGVNAPYLLYQASLKDNNQTFLIKILKQDNHLNEGNAQLQHEYYLLEHLTKNSNHFPKPVEYLEEGAQYGIVFQDQGFIPWNRAFPNKILGLNIFFPIAIQLAQQISEIHSAGIIHKNINPQSLFYHPKSQQVQIGDFSIATELKRTLVPGDPPRLLQGNLEYIAPEQTGRMNRALTQRADLYSLGILFYEWLTGSVPFSAKEPMTIIFGHIATTPRPPHEINKDVPKLLSAIVMKLLSKPAEDRYKSGLGLAHDLEQVWQAFEEDNSHFEFTLGQKDVSAYLELPDRLYGRETQVEILLKAFEDLQTNSQTKFMTVAGYSGIGKTSLVRELIPKIALAKGFFALGKFDKFQQSDTYEGLRVALDKVVRYHLSLPENEYQVFKDTIIHEMGSILPVITEFIPRLSTIVGKQTPLPEVGIEASKNRFELALRRFVKITSLHHPLVLFLDDLQWANHSMFELLQKLVLSEDIENLFVIISYRSNEIDAGHPINLFLEQISSKKHIDKIEVEGLREDALNSMLQDMLYLSQAEVNSLAHLIYVKTEGNPFFLLMLLEELYREKELYFSSERNGWCWDEAKILHMAASDNILDFVNNRIRKLPQHIKEVLHLAACIGNTFSLEELNLAELGHATFLADALQPAIQEGLIFPTQLQDEWIKGVSEKELLTREYRFQHDKIQQSCYEIYPIEESKKIHLQLARHWYAAYKDNLSDTRIMAIADQFDKGLSYIADETEKLLVCQLNLTAAKIALQSAAYEVAYQYSSFAKSLLNKTAWEDQYTLSFAVFLSTMKSSFLSHHFKESEALSEEAFKKANNNFDKATIAYIKGDLARALGKTDISHYEQGLRLLGYPKIAKIPSALEVILSVLKFKFYIHYFKKHFKALPRESDDSLELGYLLSERLAEELYFSGNIFRYVYTMTRFGTDTFEKHNIYLRAVIYVVYNIIWPHSIFSKELYAKAEPVLSNVKNKEMAASFYFPGAALHAPWHHSFSKLAAYFEKAIGMSEEAGSLELFAQSHVYQSMFQPHLTLKERLMVQKKIEYLVKDVSLRGSARLMIEKAYTLKLLDLEKNNSSQDFFDNTLILELCKKNNYSIGIFAFHAKKTSALIHLREFDQLIEEQNLLTSLLPKINKANAAAVMLPANFYLFISEIIAYPKLSFKEKFKSRLRLYSLYRRVKSWVKFCPENFMTYHLMMKAEYQGLKGNLVKALSLYDDTIRLAQEYKISECESLACQRALSLCVAHQKMDLAQVYADKALQAYGDWGALAVVQVLKEKYPDLFKSKLIELDKNISIPSREEQQKKREENARYVLDWVFASS